MEIICQFMAVMQRYLLTVMVNRLFFRRVRTRHLSNCLIINDVRFYHVLTLLKV